MYAQATLAASEAIDNLVNTIDRSREELIWQREAFEQNTVILRNTRRIRFLLCSAYPYQALFIEVAARLKPG